VDTIVIASIESSARLYLAMGTGQKTIDWQAGVMWWGIKFEGEGIITRPDASPNIIQTGQNNGYTYFFCNTNVNYRAASDGNSLWKDYGSSELFWNIAGPSNTGC
jgi:hypothetical protein